MLFPLKSFAIIYDIWYCFMFHFGECTVVSFGFIEKAE